METPEKIIQSIKQEFAPDKRVAIFDAELVPGTQKDTIKVETNIPQAVTALESKLELAGIDCIIETKLLPDSSLNGRIFGVINLSVANIRSKPDHPAELVTQALLGTVVKVYKYEDDWYLIQTPDDYLGWVDSDGIQLMTEDELHLFQSNTKVIVTEVYSNAFSGPSNDSRPVSDIVAGNIFEFLSDGENYIEVGYPDKRRGYIKKSEVQLFDQWLKEKDYQSQSILNTAFQFYGLPYLWGGTSPKGVDCSGFTKTVYFMNGILLPRDASQQVFVGELVDSVLELNNLQPGDLVFFGKKATPEHKMRATHVGIYIGNGEYIHSSGRVKINSFVQSAENFNHFRYRTYLCARRIIGADESTGFKFIKSLPQYYNSKKENQ